MRGIFFDSAQNEDPTELCIAWHIRKMVPGNDECIIVLKRKGLLNSFS